MNKKGIQTIFSYGTCKVTSGNTIVVTGKLANYLYALDMVSTTKRENEKSFSVTHDSWHERLAHVNRQGIRQMLRRAVVRGVQIASFKISLSCKGCNAGRVIERPFQKLVSLSMQMEF